MKSTIFLPSKINVGFQNRDSTYTGKLAYIIYYDEKGVLRKEKSWESWRDKNIPNEEFDNIPTSGFVLNKKAGGYSTGWNHRQTYCRVYDPRGFEFEITIPNLLYLLENATSTKGKGLEGEFVYGWDGKDLVLVPCESPDYKELLEYNNKLQNRTKLKGKDLVIGGTYLTKDNEEIVYMGRYKENNKDLTYFFYKPNSEYEWCKFTEYKNIGNVIIDTISTECISNYAEIFEQFEYYETYNPYDESRDEYIYHTIESFTDYVNNQKEWHNRRSRIRFFDDTLTDNNGEKTWRGNSTNKDCDYYMDEGLFKWTTNKRVQNPNRHWDYTIEKTEHVKTLVEFFEQFKPMYKKEYLADGKLRRVEYYE